MSDNVKVALILATTAIICLCIWIYFSPFQTCVRASKDAEWCTRAVGGSKWS